MKQLKITSISENKVSTNGNDYFLLLTEGTFVKGVYTPSQALACWDTNLREQFEKALEEHGSFQMNTPQH